MYVCMCVQETGKPTLFRKVIISLKILTTKRVILPVLIIPARRIMCLMAMWSIRHIITPRTSASTRDGAGFWRRRQTFGSLSWIRRRHMSIAMQCDISCVLFYYAHFDFKRILISRNLLSVGVRSNVSLIITSRKQGKMVTNGV